LSINATQVAETELPAGAVDYEGLTDRHIEIGTEERRQLVGFLCVADQDIDVVDLPLTQ